MTGRDSTQGDSAEVLAREKNDSPPRMIGVLKSYKLDFDFEILANQKKYERENSFLWRKDRSYLSQS